VTQFSGTPWPSTCAGKSTLIGAANNESKLSNKPELQNWDASVRVTTTGTRVLNDALAGIISGQMKMSASTGEDRVW
jgi:hypothetical protein